MRCRWTSTYIEFFLWNALMFYPNLNSNSWTSWLSCNVLNPGKIFHSNSIGSQSILSKSLYSWVVLNLPNLSSHASFDWGFSKILPRHNAESEKTWTFVRWRLMSCSSPIKKQTVPWIIFPINYFHCIDLILFGTPISQICRTFVWVWDLWCSRWDGNCSSNSSPWIQMIPMLKTWMTTHWWIQCDFDGPSHTFETVVQGYRVNAKYPQRGPSSPTGQRMTQREWTIDGVTKTIIYNTESEKA